MALALDVACFLSVGVSVSASVSVGLLSGAFSFLAFLARVELFFLCLPFVIFDFFDFSIFRRRVVFSSCLFVLGSVRSFSVYVVTCTAYRMHLIRTCADLAFYFCLEV